MYGVVLCWEGMGKHGKGEERRVSKLMAQLKDSENEMGRGRL